MGLWFFDGKLSSQIVIDTEVSVKVVKKISDDKFAYFWEHGIYIRNIQGHLLHNLRSNGKIYKFIRKLNDSLIIASFSQRPSTFGFQIWNIESGVLVKELIECE